MLLSDSYTSGYFERLLGGFFDMTQTCRWFPTLVLRLRNLDFEKSFLNLVIYFFFEGTTTIIFLPLESDLHNQNYQSVEPISPECLVMSMSRAAVGGMMNGTTITLLIIQLICAILSEYAVSTKWIFLTWQEWDESLRYYHQ